MRFTVSKNCLPIGAYLAEFDGVEGTDHPEYGDGIKFTFTVTDGPQKGRECFRTTKREPTIKNSCGRILAALAGVKPSDGLDVDTDDYIGHVYNVIVTESQSGDSTRIESLTPADGSAS